jgi:hypothetical protein
MYGIMNQAIVPEILRKSNQKKEYSMKEFKKKDLQIGDMILVKSDNGFSLIMGRVEDFNEDKNFSSKPHITATLYEERSEIRGWLHVSRIMKIFRPKVKIEFETYLPE